MREANLQASRNGPCPVVGSGVSPTVGPRKVSDRAWEGRASIQGSHGWGSRKTRRESRQFRQPALGRWAGGAVAGNWGGVTPERSKKAAGEQAGQGLASRCWLVRQTHAHCSESEAGKGKAGRPRNHVRAQDSCASQPGPPDEHRDFSQAWDRGSDTPGRVAERGAGRGLQPCGGGLGPSGSVSCVAPSASEGLSVNKGCRPSSQKGRRRNGGLLADEEAPQALSLSEAHAISKSTCSSGLHWKRRDKEVWPAEKREWIILTSHRMRVCLMIWSENVTTNYAWLLRS